MQYHFRIFLSFLSIFFNLNLVFQRCSQRKMLCKHEANRQENNHAEARSQKSCFATLLKSHPYTDAPPKILSTSAEDPLPGEHFWRTASACQKSFKKLKL